MSYSLNKQGRWRPAVWEPFEGHEMIYNLDKNAKEKLEAHNKKRREEADDEIKITKVFTVTFYKDDNGNLYHSTVYENIQEFCKHCPHECRNHIKHPWNSREIDHPKKYTPTEEETQDMTMRRLVGEQPLLSQKYFLRKRNGYRNE